MLPLADMIFPYNSDSPIEPCIKIATDQFCYNRKHSMLPSTDLQNHPQCSYNHSEIVKYRMLKARTQRGVFAQFLQPLNHSLYFCWLEPSPQMLLHAGS